MASLIQKKGKKLIALIVIAALVVIVLGIFYKGYSSDKEKYEATIKQL